MPVSGEITAVNENLPILPKWLTKILRRGWMIKIKLTTYQVNDLLTADQYKGIINE